MERIAVVDDDRVTLAVLAEVLRSGGFDVRSFDNGEEALAALSDAPVDLLVVDLLLPRMSGIDLVRELRARPWAEAVPALAITALRWNAEQILAIEASMAPAQLIAKPVGSEDLLSIVRAMLAGGSAPAAVVDRCRKRYSGSHPLVLVA
ncbi:MAG TPA: response regulator [Myxococcaceae bacterium]|nr:response regulator [Myxococcaceae bacterium]